MNDFKVGDEVYLFDYPSVFKKIILGYVADGEKYWLDKSFGYYDKHRLFKDKNAAIDSLIKYLEGLKDE